MNAKRLFLFTCTFLLSFTLFSQSSDCIINSVINDPGSNWSEQCYLGDDCEEQGNPCQANDVTLTGVYIANATGGAITTCTPGSPVAFYLWGKFHNNTGTNRYAVRTCTEVWLDGIWTSEVNACSFDVLESGDSEVILLGEFSAICGQDIQLLNTWIGWSTTAAQCSDSVGEDYSCFCGQYPPAKCSKALAFVDFLSPNFSFECGETSSTTTEICFTNLSEGGEGPLTYAWDFGDGQTSTEMNPCHTFNATSGSYTVVMTVTDANGVEAAAEFTVNLDNLDCCTLTVECPPEESGILECVEDLPESNENIIVILDSCGTITYDLQELTQGNGCANDPLVVTREYTISDGVSSVVCTQSYSIVDLVQPNIICPADIEVSCAELVPDPDTDAVDYSDGCIGDAVITFVGDEISDEDCVNGLTIIRTYMATDACGNTATCSQLISVFDDIAPSIDCPADLSVSCAGDVPAANINLINASDNCTGNVEVSVNADVISSLDCANAYLVTRVYIATDACGNSSTCAQQITVSDETPPVITCISDLILSCSDPVPQANVDAIITSDNCDGNVSVTVAADVVTPGNCVNESVITRVYTATDVCGNTATCAQTITIIDETAPSITCPANISVECSEDLPAPNLNAIVASDNCDGDINISVAADLISEGDCTNSYVITRMYIATDACGNSSTCIQFITVQDNIAPEITCLADISVSCPSSVPSANVDALVATDNCQGSVEVTVAADVVIPGDCANTYTINRVYTATDLCGNTATCLQVINVNDETAPEISCIANVTVSCLENVPAANVEALVTSDNCDGEVIVTVAADDIASGDCVNEFEITRVYTATDLCGNTSTCAQIITISDQSAPSITCLADITVSCGEAVPDADIDLIVSSDNCDGDVEVSVSADVIAGDVCEDSYTITRVYWATDACGNSTSCTQIITVRDTEAPAITCIDDLTVSCIDDVPGINLDLIVTSDNCEGEVEITVEIDSINQECVNSFTILRTFIATDLCGNSSSCTQTITINDNVAPVVTCPPGVSLSCENELPAVDVASVDVSDNCDGVILVTTLQDAIVEGSCPNNYTVIRTYVATDVCGNSSSCTQSFNVSDVTAPSITCPDDITIACTDQIPPPDVAQVVVDDNCEGTVSVTHVSDEVNGAGCSLVIVRTYQATDACGNSSTCSHTITLADEVAPLLAFVDPLLAGLSNRDTLHVQCHGQDPEWDMPQFSAASAAASDNCDATLPVNFTQALAAQGDCQEDGYINVYQLTWTVEDSCGNTAEAIVFMDLIDTVPPEIIGVPEDVTISVDAMSLLVQPNVYATDECLCACVVLVEQSSLNEGCLNGQVITRTWSATDNCGNQSIKEQRITLIDTSGPSLALEIPDWDGIENGDILLFNCSEGGIPIDFESMNDDNMSTSDMSNPISISFIEDVHTPNNCEFAGFKEERIYTWEALDQCENATSFSFHVQLIDNTEPTIIGVPETGCLGDPDLNNLEAIDDCGDAALRYWDVPIQNPCGPGTALRRTYEAEDGCGNMSRDTAILLPDDNVEPVLAFTNPELIDLDPSEVINVSCQSQNGQLTPFGVHDVAVTDGCLQGTVVTFSERMLSHLDCVNEGRMGEIELVWTATDNCGNATSLSLLANLVDETGPVFTDFEREITIDCDEDMPLAAAADNCSDVNITYSDEIIEGPCEFKYDVLRTITATDDCGNASVTRQMVHVGGDEGPEFAGIEEVICDDLSLPVVTAYDACAGQFVEYTMVEDTLESECLDGLVIERTWSAADACGDVTEIKQRVIIGDHVAPEILIPSWSIIHKFLDVLPVRLIMMSETDILNELNDLDANSITAMDNCEEELDALFTLLVSYPDNVTEAGYSEERTYSWMAADECGNSSVISFTVHILDDMPPVAEAPADTLIVCAPLPPAEQMLPQDSSETTVVYNETINETSQSGVYMVIRTWTVTDMSGNSTVAQQHIRWQPDSFLECEIAVPETVECNTHGVIISSDVSGGVAPYTYYWEVVGDKCFIQGGQGTPEISIYVGWTEVLIRLTVSDIYGCVTVCERTLPCVDPYIGLKAEDQLYSVISQPELTHTSTYTVEDIFHQLHSYPNPSNGTINLRFEADVDAPFSVTVTNLLGRDVYTETLQAVKGENRHKLNLINLPGGSYMLRLQVGESVYAENIILLQQD